MSKINEIQNKIKELNGGDFQCLMDAFLAAKGFENIHSIGTVVGTNKTRKGTPDALVVDGCEIVFVEYSVQQNRLYEKFLDDIEKCLDVEKTGVEIENITKIIIGFTGRLDAEEISKLRDKCNAEGVDVELIGIETLSNALYNYYPSLVRDILGLSIDTGQVVRLDNFIEYYDANALAAKLNTQFEGREEDVDNAYKGIEENRVVLISGKPGVGKTRLAIEICRRYIAEHQVDCYAIFNRGQNIFDDLKVYFSKKGEYLIFVDDANRVSNFDYFIDLLLTSQSNIKIIATVRDYAKQNVEESTKKVGNYSNIILNDVSDDEIRNVIRGNYKIGNPLYIDRIVEIAQGNLRIAIMASKLAIEENKISALSNVFDLYDNYYSKVIGGLLSKTGVRLIEVAGIVSFLKIISMENEEEIELIFKAFSVDKEHLKMCLLELHDLEIIDSYENRIFKGSDQVMMTYFFYYVFMYKKFLDISIIFDVYYFRDSKSVIEILNSTTASYYSEEILELIKSHAKRLYVKSLENGGTRNILKSFGGLLPTEVLRFLRSQIDLLSEPIDNGSVYEIDYRNQHVNDENLDLFMTIRNGSNAVMKMQIELLLEYTRKRPDLLTQVHSILTRMYGFSDKNVYSNFEIQNTLIDILMEKIVKMDIEVIYLLFIGFCKHLLQIEFEHSKPGRGDQYIFARYSLPDNEYVEKLRYKIFDYLAEMCNKSGLQKQIIEVFSHMYDGGYNGSNNNIIVKESEKLYEIFSSILKEDEIESFTNISHLLMIYETREIECERFERLLHGPLWELYLIIMPERMRRKFRELGYDEMQKRKYDLLKDYTSTLELDEILKTVDSYYTFFLNKEIRSTIHDIQFSYEQFLLYTFDLYEDDVKNILERDFLHKSEILTHRDKVISKLIERLGAKEVYSIILEIEDDIKKGKWLFEYWRQVIILENTPDNVQRLISLYSDAPVDSIPYNTLYYFEKMDLEVTDILLILKVIYSRSKENREILSRSADIFQDSRPENKYIVELLNLDRDFIGEMYLGTLGIQQYFDYQLGMLKQLLEKDKMFIFKFIEYLYAEDMIYSIHRGEFELEFIWEEDEPLEYLNEIIAFIVEMDIRDKYYSRSVMVNLFKTENQEIIEKQKDYILSRFPEENTNVELMKALFDVSMRKNEDFKLDVIRNYLEINTDIEIFKELSIDSEINGWSGSAVPVIDRKIQYLKKILDMCNSIDLLDHREYIEELIRSNEYWKEKEKQRDFTGRW